MAVYDLNSSIRQFAAEQGVSVPNFSKQTAKCCSLRFRMNPPIFRMWNQILCSDPAQFNKYGLLS
jgi:hypothetical protein